jgi:outer membrane protein TolC
MKVPMKKRSRIIHYKPSHRMLTRYAIALSALFSTCAGAQMLAPQQQGARAQQVPFSTREQGTASVLQQAGTGAGSSVNTVESTINISGGYQGSVLDSSASASELTLTFDNAIQRGLHFNLGGVTAGNQQSEFRSQRLAALSQLLPSVTGVLSQTVAQLYLPSEGITSNLFGGAFRVPNTTGQFHYYTLQGSLSQDALDMTAVHNLRGAEASSNAAKFDVDDARELVVLGVGGTYIQALAAAATLEAQRKEVDLAEASFKQANAQHGAGTRANIDANRSHVELRTEQQRLASDEAELLKQKIQLARLIGVPPGARIQLSSRLAESLTGRRRDSACEVAAIRLEGSRTTDAGRCSGT